ncbi:nucleotidyltransferase domain-containing protein [Fibrella sp. HMF5335]|uniref:Nucleotidyltransferase domain-containing protein n=1 Tax=Fibrella rubiginis TaxID=2817060 RepID=A0A939GJ32_9BACT|nr:nucleotidyltransferase domain-containing protein [Fibrella rubiginis]MBO0937686.1 nucleotidyltransferase domain-containing protein [Fibrella rubiginis]
MTSLQQITSEFKQSMLRLYGDQLAQVILYGSYARGDYNAESDVDLAVVLHIERVERWREVERIAPVVVDLSVKYNCLISPIVLEASRLNGSQNLFIRHVRQEGIAL